MNHPNQPSSPAATYVDRDGRTAPDRRANPRVRAVFDEAYELIHPFFDPATAWGGTPLDLLAFRTLRDAFPDLSRDEVHVIITVAERVYRERGAAETHPSGAAA